MYQPLQTVVKKDFSSHQTQFWRVWALVFACSVSQHPSNHSIPNDFQLRNDKSLIESSGSLEQHEYDFYFLKNVNCGHSKKNPKLTNQNIPPKSHAISSIRPWPRGTYYVTANQIRAKQWNHHGNMSTKYSNYHHRQNELPTLSGPCRANVVFPPCRRRPEVTCQTVVTLSSHFVEIVL